MEGQQDSLWPLQQLVKMWSNGARDEEIERVVQTLKHELRRRGHRDHLQPDGRGIDRRAERDPCQSRSGQVDDACPAMDPRTENDAVRRSVVGSGRNSLGRARQAGRMSR